MKKIHVGLAVFSMLLFGNMALGGQGTTKIVGRVIDEDGNPLFGVRIQYNAVTDFSSAPDGTFSLPTISAWVKDDIYLTISKEGYYLPSSFNKKDLYKLSASERGIFLTLKMQKAPLPTDKKRIGVLPFCDDSPNGASLIDGAFTSKASEALSYIDEEQMEVVSYMQLWVAMKNANLGWGEYCAIDQIIDLAGSINANVVVMGMYKKQKNGTWRVNCSFLDLTEQKPLYRDIYEADSSLVGLQEKMYNSILERLDIKLTEETKTIIASHTTKATTNDKAYMHSLNGTQYFTQGDYKKAKKEQTQAIEEDDNYFRAYEERAKVSIELEEFDNAESDYKQAKSKAKKKGIIKKIIEWIIPEKDLPNHLPEMVYVEGGTFTMGCTDEQGSDCDSDEKPAHQVTLNSFEIGKYEVTVSEYMAFVNATSSHYPEWLETGSKYHIKTGSNDLYKKLGEGLEAKKNPIVGISWEGAKAYAQWISAQTGETYRLPTEAEWEYAARGGNKSKGYKYAGTSSSLDAYAWYSSNSKSKTQPVGQKSPNELGLYDMSGNVYEWCQDWHSEDYYKSSPETNPQGPESGSDRVGRGGSWHDDAHNTRVSNRYNNNPDYRYNNLGFRLSKTITL
jgi:formylglycine-generating enzyme required for sulfatase activity